MQQIPPPPPGLLVNGIWHCHCDPALPAEHYRVKKDGPNRNRWFYVCPRRGERQCGFFLWDDDARVRGRGGGVGCGGRGVHDGRSVSREGRAVPRVRFALMSGGKRTFREAGLDDEEGEEDQEKDDNDEDENEAWSLDEQEEQALVQAVDASVSAFASASASASATTTTTTTTTATNPSLASSTFETPRKARKTGVYSTPSSRGAKSPRKLPWLDGPTTPRSRPSPAVQRTLDHYLTSPSKPPPRFRPLSHSASASSSARSPRPPTSPPRANPTSTTPTKTTTTTTTTTTPPQTPRSNHLNSNLALDTNPSSTSTTNALTHDVLSALATVTLPPPTEARLRDVLARHELRAQGVMRGRDLAREALRVREGVILELRERIVGLEAGRESGEREGGMMGKGNEVVMGGKRGMMEEMDDEETTDEEL